MIREFEKKDLAACAAVFREAFSEETWGCVWSQERAETYLLDYVSSPKFVGFVSEENGKIDGAILACRKVSWNADELHIDEMFVDPNKQRTGVGQQLLAAMKDYSKNNGLAGIVLYTAQEAPAMKFYQKNGFQVSDGVICMYWV